MAALLLSLSCDDGSSPAKFGNLAKCGDFTACGGSVVGTWKLSSSCSDIRTVTNEGCTQTIDILEYAPNVTFTFTSDGSYISQGTVSGKVDLEYSKECLADLKMTCEGLSSMAMEDVKLSCTSDTNGGCQCSETVANMATKEEGTYTSTGTSITRTLTSGKTFPASDYCVQGNTLKIRDFGEPKGTGDGSSIIVLTKQ